MTTRTRKPAKIVADLPIETTTTAPVKAKRTRKPKADKPSSANSSPVDPAAVPSTPWVEEIALAKLTPLPPDGSPEQIALELRYAGEALLDFEQSDLDQKRKIEEFKAQLASGTVDDEIYENLVGYYDWVLDLEGKLRASEAVYTRDVAATQADLDAAEIAAATAEAFTASILEELGKKNALIEQLKITTTAKQDVCNLLGGRLASTTSENKRLAGDLAKIRSRGFFSRLFNRAA